MSRRAAALALVLSAAVWAGCASSARGPGGPATSGVRLTLPFVAQTGPHLCGVACLEMLTRCYGHALGSAAIRSLKAEAVATGGVSGASMKAALESAGYEVAVYPGTLDRGPTGVLKQVDKGLPVLVMTGLDPRHYCLVAGYDEQKGTISLMDPARGRVEMPFSGFEAVWGESGHFSLLAAPKPA